MSIEQMKKDIVELINHPIYNGSIVKSDLVDELRSNFNARVRHSGRKWKMSTWFINSDLEDIMDGMFNVEIKPCGGGYSRRWSVRDK